MNREIVGFIGEIGAGKTYLSLEKVKELKYDGKTCMVTSWADAVKDIIANTLGLLKSGPVSQDTLEYLEIVSFINIKDIFCRNFAQEIERTNLHIDPSEIREKLHGLCQIHKKPLKENIEGIIKDPDNYSRYYRSIIQMVGTEFGRSLHENLWIEITMAKIQQVLVINPCVNIVVIDDIRFINEYDAITNFADTYNIKSNIYGVKASIEVRSQRTGLSIQKLEEYAIHGSEKYIPELMSRLPEENIIFNN